MSNTIDSTEGSINADYLGKLLIAEDMIAGCSLSSLIVTVIDKAELDNTAFFLRLGIIGTAATIGLLLYHTRKQGEQKGFFPPND